MLFIRFVKNNNMKKFFSIILLCLAQNAMFAQMGYGKPEDIKQVAAKTLLVVLDAENPKTIKKLEKKPEELKQYREDIAAYNAGVKAAFTKTWKFSNEVKFVSAEGLDSIKDDKSKSKLYAYFTPKIHRRQYTINVGDPVVPNTYTLDLGLTDQKKPVYTMMFSTLRPTEGDLTFVIQQFEGYFKQRLEKDKSPRELMAEIVAKSPLLKQKTLLIDKDQVNNSLTKNIAAVYKYKYELCTKEKIDNAIINHDAAYVYIKAIPVAQIVDRNLTKSNEMTTLPTDMYYMQYVINAEDGTYASLIESPNKDGKTSKGDIEGLVKRIEGK